MKFIDELKKEYWKHFNTMGVTDADVLNEDAGEVIYCECATEGDCKLKRDELLRAISVLEENSKQ